MVFVFVYQSYLILISIFRQFDGLLDSPEMSFNSLYGDREDIWCSWRECSKERRCIGMSWATEQLYTSLDIISVFLNKNCSSVLHLKPVIS